jgi:hypothetical protein
MTLSQWRCLKPVANTGQSRGDAMFPKAVVQPANQISGTALKRALEQHRVLTHRPAGCGTVTYRCRTGIRPLNMAEGGDGQKASVGTLAIFISYAPQDADVANALVAALKRQGLHVLARPAGPGFAIVPQFRK